MLPQVLTGCRDVAVAGVWEHLSQLLDQAEATWQKRCEGYLETALANIKRQINSVQLGEKRYKFTMAQPLIDRYFTNLSPDTSTRSWAHIVAHNGWSHEEGDFAAKEGFQYLKRAVAPWTDCVKLYYGAKPADNPYLWTHMEQYVSFLASVFQGIRIDNCHSTPLHVLEYYLTIARSINPNLYVFAELFTNDHVVDAMFARRTGLNALIRESIYVPTNVQTDRCATLAVSLT